MAEALVVSLVCPVIKIVVEKAKCCASDRVKWLSDGVPKALKRLENLLEQLRTVAGAVQRRGSPDRNGDLRAWLQQLMDAVYEAHDVLDDFDDSVPQPESSVLRLGRRIFGADERVNRLKDVVEKLEAIHAGSPTLLAATETIASASMAREPSGSHRLHGGATGPVRHHEDAVIGREKELREMVSWLVGNTSDADAKSASVPVAAIMGLGGMGKTTLAQLLFQDQEVASTFDLRIWVHPAAMDNELELARQIPQSANVDVPDGMRSFHWLQTKLEEKVSSHKFLLVIDDVWNREDMGENGYREMWSKVLAPLSNGKTAGSKIVVTTRQKIVATSLRAREVCLGDLPANDIWSLFTRYAFGDEVIDKQPPELRAIGRKIAEKLRGSPLAAKAVGQMLEGRRSVSHWTKVLEMDGFDDVSKTLELCYQNLPEHLQPCFAICSLFPKNWRFKRDKLVKIWMALDFIQADNGSEKTQLEDVGSGYFDELVDRSFFHRQKVGRRRRYYYIHDLMHDLAEKVSRFDCLRVEDAKKEIPKTIRHLSVSSDTMVQLKGRCDFKRLRTLLILKNSSSSLDHDQLPSDLFIELKGLRVLGLEGCNIIRLSERIVNLKYLRYLALCKSITRLPQAVTKLYRLQTFSSPKGSGLEVPEDIVDLKHLRHLDMDTSKITGIGKLVRLQGSVKFHVKKEKGHTLGDLDGMSALRKELHIKNLDIVKNQKEACQAGLNKKDNVKVLELEWNSTGKSVPSAEAEVLDGLEPNHYVKKLIIRRYHGNRSPHWLNNSLEASDFYIKYLYLINCRKWEAMPPLGQLPCLKVLHLKEMCSVKKIGGDFYGNKSTAFPSLEELEFDDMPQWVEWTHEENIEVLPKLRKLRLLNCPLLIKVPHLPLSVRKVSVKNSGFVSQLKLYSSSSQSKACKFALDTCSATVLTNGLMHQQQVEGIANLTLRNYQNVKFEELQVLTSLKRLQISHSSINDQQLGTCLRVLQALTWLEISNCNNITCLPQMESSDCLIKLHELHIQQCSELSSLHSLPSFVELETILIENCSKVTAKSFPTNFNCNNSLRKLSIMNCTKMESLPSGFPSSLQVLHLIGCKPSLMNQLQVKDGAEWDKVASIPIKQIL